MKLVLSLQENGLCLLEEFNQRLDKYWSGILQGHLRGKESKITYSISHSLSKDLRVPQLCPQNWGFSGQQNGQDSSNKRPCKLWGESTLNQLSGEEKDGEDEGPLL